MSSKIKKLEIFLSKKMSLVEFFKNYYGINNITFSCAKHEDIKRLMPNVKRCSYEFITDNYNLVCDGTVIMVEDYRGKIAPYYNPLRQGLFFSEEQNHEVVLQKVKEKKDYDEINNIPTYQLKKNMHDELHYKHYKNARIIKNELFERGAFIKSSRKRLIENERRKEEYDKY